MTQTGTAVAVKGTYEHMGRTCKTYWNGKTYGTRVYVTITYDTGKQYKVAYNSAGAGNRAYEYSSVFDLTETKDALRSVGLLEEVEA